MAFETTLLAQFQPYLEATYYGNTGRDYLTAFLVFLGILILLKIFKVIIIQRLKSLAKRTSTNLDDLLIDIVDSVKWPFFILMALFAGLQFLTLPEAYDKYDHVVILIVATYYGLKIFDAAVDHIAGTQKEKRLKEEKQHDVSVIDMLANASKVILVGLAVVFLLSNLGINISALIAGLGIGGIAIAFALQKVLSDLLASISIYFDKPFQIGDFIIIGDDLGTVEKIGIMTTRIKTLQGQELIVPNQELISTRVNNYKRMERRRIAFMFGLTYDSPSNKLEKVPEIVRKIFDKIELADLDRVHFKEFGDFSLNFEIVYYVNSKEYGDYMDTQQEVNLQLKKHIEKENLEFAFPTQTIHLAK